MKQCPTCGSSYTDDTLVYCLQDGGTLQQVSQSQNPLSMVSTLRGDEQGHEAASENTVYSSAPTVEIPSSVLLTSLPQEVRPTKLTGGEPSHTSVAEPTRTSRVIFLTVLATILLLAAGGMGAWMLFRGRGDSRGRLRRAGDANTATVNSDTSANANSSNAEDRPDKGGRWFVIMGSYPKAERGSADERLERVRRQGFDAHMIASDDYPNFESGLWLIVMGPYTRNNAQDVLEQVRSKIKDAYTKSGW